MSNDEESSGGLGKCVVCGGHASALYPLLPNSPAFCSEHHNPKDAGPFGCDFSGPDDFEIPEPPWPETKFNMKTFVWTDKEGNKHKLRDIDDRYLQNIINFLKRRVTEMGAPSAEYWQLRIDFLVKAQKIRAREGLNEKI